MLRNIWNRFLGGLAVALLAGLLSFDALAAGSHGPQGTPGAQPAQGAQSAPAAQRPVRSSKLFFGLYLITPRETVSFSEKHPAGTIIVKQSERRLYFVLGDGKALRYPIAVGREGASWSGTSTISAKREWPDWTPTPAILARQPDLPRHMEGGPQNPLGARALYLGKTLYRIHGTNEPWAIGEDVSSGCIRLSNDDVIDLYDRARVGATVIVQH
jgi:lipoprotein-anchoring transpeptidase ErfK/SrfK